MGNQIKILVTRDFPDIGIQLLTDQGFDLTIWTNKKPMTKAQFIENAQGHEALLCTLTEEIDKTFLLACPHLKMISQFAVGYDNIDIKEATILGIPVGFTPDAMTEATADIAFGLMIAVSRKFFFLHKTILHGQWDYFTPKANLGIELKNKTLGIFGMGRIGMKMAQRCRAAYDMNIIYYSRTPNLKAQKKFNAKLVSFEQLLVQSDVLSVHCTLNDSTKEVFDIKAFAKMKKSAIFINTARGGIHNEKDLTQALESRQIWGAGLDVTNPEPMVKGNPLLSMENVCVLPHVGSGTREARDEMSRLAAMNLISFYKNGTIPHIVNPQVLNNEKPGKK